MGLIIYYEYVIVIIISLLFISEVVLNYFRNNTFSVHRLLSKYDIRDVKSTTEIKKDLFMEEIFAELAERVESAEYKKAANYSHVLSH